MAELSHESVAKSHDRMISKEIMTVFLNCL